MGGYVFIASFHTLLDVLKSHEEWQFKLLKHLYFLVFKKGYLRDTLGFILYFIGGGLSEVHDKAQMIASSLKMSHISRGEYHL